ncbi:MULTISPECIES: branched-chain amino acid ABC transporter permease [Variovorax]|uniref:Branched-chain amino acid transport system permease protein n=1 Tax=Variovorax boronicumulans TaxID=436515 RepID=A0AAW8E4R1_9BURK|nr:MULTISPECIES: branched-chain amino acid ABC transporter permease [Variovorax]MDP9881809.1 branched-chain amino acid transport system permease protein [Variovorax boronicumulans]MDP9914998.1 branched-chain amino acid transport system permease protein [Variovorax boronicumulans]MDP9926878.1 branched-chain amino acid transport system permease protein [Variovorax boronicumulans]PBI90728.1 High-affinity branched-chain amino acid transport system permease protein LivH [Variovorax boronicumulans]T
MGIVIFDGVAYGMLLFLIGVGLSITMGLMNFVNLAHGSFAMVGGYAASVLMNQWGLGFGLSLAAAFVAAAVVGAVLEFVFYRRLYRAHPLDQVLLSIGVVFVSIAAFTYFFGPTMQPFTLPKALEGQVSLLGLEVGRYRLFLIGCGVAVLVALLLGLGKTRYGAMVRAAVDNQRVAGGTGIHVQRLFFLTFSLGCGLAGLGGALSLGMLGLEPSFPLKYLVYFLMVVCVGGAGTVTGPFIAALLVGIVDVAGKYYLPETGAFLIYVFMIVMLLVRPNGIVAKKGLA